jgi:MtrB/PioB family decaheme-associated outer membrane protein
MHTRKIGDALLTFAIVCFLAAPAWSQIELGDFIISGAAEVTGLPMKKNGSDAKFEEYRDIPETLIVPEIQLMIGGKKEDFFIEFDSSKLGRDDQYYKLRFGRYGLLDVEFEWDQIPHVFSRGIAQTPYSHNGNGTYTLSTKPITTAGTDIRDWVNTDAHPIDLKLFNGIGRLKLRYTPSPGWNFTAGYSSWNSSGKRAFGAVNGPSPGSYNISELPEPIDYQTHNIELGGEYGGNGWSIGLKYNGSLFHNNVNTLVWDNAINLTTGPCIPTANYVTDGTGGPCQGRIDLYPSNQAHMFTLSGAAALPFKTRFMGTVSYGWRLQDDDFIPFTINPAVAQVDLPRKDLDGDVRPLMINATLANGMIPGLDLRAFYRLFDFDNRSARVFFEEGIVVNDQGPGAIVAAPTAECPTATNLVNSCLRSFPYSYSKQNIGFDAGYKFTNWLAAKFGYVWERMHRERREVLNSDEHIFGPTFDLTPTDWLLVRMGYKRFIRDAHDYDAGRNVVVYTFETPEDLRDEFLAALRKFDEAAREKDKYSLFTQITPLQNLTLYGGFDFTIENYPRSEIGVQNDINYSPSIGFAYAPLEWLTLFGDYNWERFDWKIKAMERTSTAQTPEANPDRVWRSRGRDQIHTVSFGGDLRLIKELLGLRVQYTYSGANSLVRASGNTCGGCTAATDYPAITNRLQELLVRFEYLFHKNVALRFGYFYSRFAGKDFGVDIMKPWMGDVDTGANVQRSIFLGDQIKTPYEAHVGFVGLRFKF